MNQERGEKIPPEGQLSFDLGEETPFSSIFDVPAHDDTVMGRLGYEVNRLMGVPLTTEELDEIDRIAIEAGLSPNSFADITPELEARLIEAIKASRKRGFWQDWNFSIYGDLFDENSYS